MGASNSSNCKRQNNVDKSLNGVQETSVPPTAPPETTTSGAKMDDAKTDDCSPALVTAAGVPSTDDETGKRRHSTPTCGTAHLSRLGADSPGEYDVRCRRSGSAAPRRANRQTKDESYRRTAALPAWAKAVRSSRAESSTSAQRRSSGGSSELGYNDGVRLESTTTNDPASRQELLQANYAMDERRDRVDSMGSSGGRSSGGVRCESQMTGDISSSPPRAAHHFSSSLHHQTAAQAVRPPPPQQRRSSIAFLPISPGSTSSGLFSPRSVGPAAATKDRINLGLGNASDFVASLIGTRGPDPAAEATEDHFWVPPTIWKKKRAQSLIPQKLSSETRILSGKQSRCSLCNTVVRAKSNMTFQNISTVAFASKFAIR